MSGRAEFARRCVDDYSVLAVLRGRAAVERDARECLAAADWLAVEAADGGKLAATARLRASCAETVLAMDARRLDRRYRMATRHRKRTGGEG